MGQQESHAPGAGSAALSRAASESSQAQEPPVGSTSSVPGSSAAGGRPGRRRMDKLFRRAQSAVESKLRGRDRVGSPGTLKTLKRDSGADSESSLEATPNPSPRPAYNESRSIPVDIKHGDDGNLTGSSAGAESVFLAVNAPGDRRSGSSFASDQLNSDMDEKRSRCSNESSELGRSGTSSDRYCKRPVCLDEELIAVHKPSGSTSSRPIPVIQNGAESQNLGFSPTSHSPNLTTNGEPKSSSPRTKGLICSLYSPGGGRTGLSSPLMIEDKRPEELQGHLAPIVTTADLGLSPIEERSDTLSIGSKSNEEISRYNTAATNGQHKSVSNGKDQFMGNVDTLTKHITDTSNLTNNGALQDSTSFSETPHSSRDSRHKNKERRPARVIDYGSDSSMDANNAELERQRASRSRLPGYAILPDRPFPIHPGDGGHYPPLAMCATSPNESTESSVEPLETSPEEYSPMSDAKKYLGLPTSTNSSAFSSPTEEVFTDAFTDRSPGDSTYVSAAESHTSSRDSLDDQDATILDESAESTPKNNQAHARMSQSVIEARTDEGLDLGMLRKKSSSLDNLDKDPMMYRTHKLVEASYSVSTSRVLSTSGNDRSRPPSQTQSERTTPSQSPTLKRKKGTGSDQDLPSLDDNENVFHQTSSNSRAMDFGMETTNMFADDENMPSESFITNIREARFDFARQIRLLDDNFLSGDSNTEPESDPELFGTRYNNWMDGEEDRCDDPQKQRRILRPSLTSNRINRRSRFTSDSPDIQAIISPGDGDGHQVAPLKPASRCASLSEVVVRPDTVPEKLDFKHLEKFEGHMLLAWLCSKYDDHHYLFHMLNKQDLRVIAAQFCTHLLVAGVIKPVEDAEFTVFKPDHMYYWSHMEPVVSQSDVVPRKLSMGAWPPNRLEGEALEGELDGKGDAVSPENGNVQDLPKLSENHSIVTGLKREMKEELDRKKKKVPTATLR